MWKQSECTGLRLHPSNRYDALHPGDDVSVGHGAIVHGATVRKGALIGMNATVLDKADIGEGAIIAAGAVVTHGTKVPAHEIWAGIPARKVKACAPGQAEEFAKHYSGYIKDWYLKEDK